MFTTTPLASDQIFMKTNSIQPGLQPWHVIQIFLSALKKGTTSCERPNLDLT